MKTYTPKQISWAERKWYVIDAKWQTLGRLASKIAPILRGKNKVDFASHVDNGDNVIVLNSANFKVHVRLLSQIFYILLMLSVIAHA